MLSRHQKAETTSVNDLDLHTKTYPELNRNREIIETSLFSDRVAAFHAWEVNISRFYNALLALESLDKLFCKSGSIIRTTSLPYTELTAPEARVGHGQSSGSGATLCLNNLITAKLDAFNKR